MVTPPIPIPPAVQFLRALLATRFPASILPPPEPGALDIAAWDFFLDLACYHQLAPLLYDTLRKRPDIEVPEAIRSALRSHYRFACLQSLRLTAELKRIAIAFHEESVAWLSWKGPTLAHRLWGDPALRPSGDIDLAVGPHHWNRTVQALRHLGYHARYPLPKYCPDLLVRSGQHCWYFDHATRNLEIEVHWVFIPPSFGSPLSVDDAIQHAETVSLHGQDLPVPSFADDWLLVCWHAAKHDLGSLLAVADIAAGMAALGHSHVDRLLERVTAARCETVLRVCMLVASQFIGLPFSQASHSRPVPTLAAKVWRRWADHDWKPLQRHSLTAILGLVVRRVSWQDTLLRRIRCFGLLFSPKKNEIAGSTLPPAMFPVLYLKRPFSYMCRWRQK